MIPTTSMRRGVAVLRFCALLTLAACGTTDTHHVLTGPPGPRCSGDVAIVLETAPVPSGLQEVAIVQAVGHGMHADLEHVIRGLKEEARRLGCTHVVRVRIDQGSSMASASGVAARIGGVAVPALAPAATPPPAAPPTGTTPGAFEPTAL